MKSKETTFEPETQNDAGSIKNINKFRQTFQKPSQIYKFLRETWKTKPLYLVRNLSFVIKSREHKSRRLREYRIDDICQNLSKDALYKMVHEHGITKLKNSKIPLTSFLERPTPVSEDTPSKDKICYYNWICDDPEKTSQKTKSRGFICAWCYRDFRCLESLMTHLRCSHQRLNFNLAREADGQVIIEMTLNLAFDGSYHGFKYPGHDRLRDFRFTYSEPERRVSTTRIIYFRPRDRSVAKPDIKFKTDLDTDGFGIDEGEADIDVCSGRLYYHTSTCLPVKPNEGDIDSEADIDPDWLRERTQLMIDEFTDVNEGEKEILKLWNLHIMKNYKYKGDNHIPQACIDFVRSEGETILSRNLCKNFYLHLSNLFDFGLLSSGDFLDCVRELKSLKSKPVVISTSPTKASGKRTSNEHCQHSPPAKRALLNSHCNK